MASRRSWAKAENPLWSNRDGSLVPRRAGGGDLPSEARSFDDKFVAVGAPSAEQRRAAQTCRTSAEFAPESVETAAEEKALKRQKEASARSLRRAHGQRCSSGVPGHASRSDEFQWNGTCRARRSAGLPPHSLRIRRDRLEQCGDELDWRSVLHRSAWCN